ncbi:MAG TPA: LPS-assembly protein LptD [Burkholderiales bacterium]|nr:LPS-assembly protein LptD [Burkholderiales bacterium]
MIRPSLHPIALALACIFPLPASALDNPVDLRIAENLSESPRKSGSKATIFFEADQLEGEAEDSMRVTGNARMSQEGLTVKADSIEYTEVDTTATAQGNVVVDKAGDQTRGPFLRYNLQTDEGFMQTPDFSFAKKEGRLRASRGNASRVQFEGPDRDRLFDARYTTCSANNNDWYLRAKELELDRTTQVGIATHASIVFKDVPILYLPFIDFPLDGQRKSGFLTPSLGSSEKNGLTIDVPYYWNIAPNYDATITPRVLTKRGVLLDNEFRYLQQTFTGQIDAEYLPGDNVTDKDRYFGRLQHRHNPIPDLSLALDLQKASDGDYLSDISTRIADTSQSYLPRDGILTYTFGGYWTAFARMLRYQPLTGGTIPYILGPQLQLNGGRSKFHGFDLEMRSEWVDFEHPTLINATRTIVNPAISYPMTQSYGYITPRLSYHSTRYSFGENNPGGLSDISRNLPILSVDSTLFLEKDTKLGDTNYKQTLEPRLFYVRAPYREQSQIPNFSTSELDFGFAQIFSDNPFIGGDRIADADHLTVGATTRLIDPENGIERIRAVLAQRYYFATQRVTLTGLPQTDQRSDVLVGLSGQVTDHLTLDSTVQYNTDLGRTEKYSAGIRYQPAPGKVISLSHRYTRDSLRQIDVSTQWPISQNWYGLSRVNYSLLDHRLVEGLVGLEYNRDCWALRMVAHRFPIPATAEQPAGAEGRTTTSFFFQLELTGLSAIGINPLETLKQNIPGYAKTTEITK